MKKKEKAWLNIIGLVVFLLAMPLFFWMGGGQLAMAEVLPGQADVEGLSFSALFEKEKEAVVSAELIGIDEVEFSRMPAISASGRPLSVSAEELKKMKDLSYLRSKYYIVDSRTSLLEGDVKVEEALSLDLSIEQTKKDPKILIFHTHIHEGFADSDMSKGLSEGIWEQGRS